MYKFRYGKWNEAAKVPVGLSGPAALYDFIYGDQFTDEAEYMVPAGCAGE